MKVLMVNGSPHKEGCTYTALKEVAGALEKYGIESEIFWVGNGEIAGCIGCGACAATCKNSSAMLFVAAKEPVRRREKDVSARTL